MHINSYQKKNEAQLKKPSQNSLLTSFDTVFTNRFLYTDLHKCETYYVQIQIQIKGLKKRT